MVWNQVSTTFLSARGSAVYSFDKGHSKSSHSNCNKMLRSNLQRIRKRKIVYSITYPRQLITNQVKTME